MTGSKRPEDRNQQRSHDDDKYIEGDAQLEIITEAIIARTVDQQVGLVADRGSKTGAGTETYGNDEWFGIYV